MSVSKWAYTPEKCDGQPCPGDCDHCAKQSLYEMTKEEAIRLIGWLKCTTNREDDLEAIDMAIEALSAEAVQEWIPFKKRPLTDEEKQEYPDWTYIFDCPLPDDEEEILLSNGKYVWTDTFINDGECYLDGGDDIDEGMAWMPLPKPYKGGAE